MAKIKKSSIALLLGAALLGGSVAVSAATSATASTYAYSGSYSFYDTLYLPIEETRLGTAPKLANNSLALITFVETNCGETSASTTFRIRDNITGYLAVESAVRIVNSEVYENRDLKGNLVTSKDTNTVNKHASYTDEYVSKSRDMYLTGVPGGGYSGFWVEGYWSP